MDRAVAERFARRQRVDFTIFNGDRILLYLQVRRRYRWLGAAGGLVFCVATFAQGSIVISAYLPLAGWLLGSMAAEIGFARSRPRVRRRLDLRLAPPGLTFLWALGAAISCAVALSAVARSYWMEVGVRERLYAVLTLGVVLAVHLIVRDLHRRAPEEGPADLVGAEFAIRSGSARSLLATGTTIALWTASGSLPELPDLGQLATALIALGLPVLVLGTITDTWQVTYAMSRRSAWPALTATLLAAALTATSLVWEPQKPGEARQREIWSAIPHVQFAALEEDAGTWRLWSASTNLLVQNDHLDKNDDVVLERPLIVDIGQGTVTRLDGGETVTGWTAAGLALVHERSTDRLPGHVGTTSFVIRSPRGKVVRRLDVPGNQSWGRFSPSGRTLATLAREVTPGDVVTTGVVLVGTSKGHPKRTITPRQPPGRQIAEILRWEDENTLVVRTVDAGNGNAYHLLDLKDGAMRPIEISTRDVVDLPLNPMETSVVLGSVR